MTEKTNNAEMNALLNAYLDGELSSAKSEKVEQLLENNSEARQLFNELKNVSNLVNSLPRAVAPPELARDVLMDLERDLLLDKSDDLAEMAGRKHLAVRRFAAAAAMVALTGAIAFIINNIWSDATTFPATFENDNNPGVRIVDSTGNDIDLLPRTKNAVKGHPSELIDSTPIKDAAPLVIPPLEFPELKYSSLALIVKSDNGQIGRVALEELLADEKISNPLVHSIDEQKKQYAFLCSLEQFKGLFRAINQNSLHPLDLKFSDPADNYQITLGQASLGEAMALAGEGNPLMQVASLMKLASPDRITFAGDTSTIIEQMQTYLATVDPALDDIHLSAVEEKATHSGSPDANSIMPEPYPPTFQPGITANKDINDPSSDIEKAAPASLPVKPVTSEPVQKVAVLLTLAIIPAEPQPQETPEVSPWAIEPAGDPNTFDAQEMPARDTIDTRLPLAD
ncbi:MAG: hypothetical protein K9M57_10555 [Phycisphaerae bacterium]|nr:hypothetical protein [Phycisphaerae bacterium]